MKPRQISPGKSFMLTRRTTQGQFLLSPCKEVTQIFRYCLGLAQQRTGMEIHCYLVMSNHFHLVGTDKEGALPAFTAYFNSLVGRALNHVRGRRENFWAGGVQPSQVYAEQEEDLISQIIYTMTNPVAAGLVSQSKDWPGDKLMQPGRYKVKRPTFFFRNGNESTLPKEVEILIAAPRISGEDQSKTTKRIKTAILEREHQIRIDFKKEGRRFMGAARVKAQSFLTTAKKKLPFGSLSPRFAAKVKEAKENATERLKAFANAHTEALALWRSGTRDVVFPEGTYRMALLHGVECQPCAET